MKSTERPIFTGCMHNCGGRCPLVAFVKDNEVVRVEGNLGFEEHGTAKQVRPCLRGRAYRGLLYHPKRLKQPLKRTGERGSGKFTAISWTEAVSEVARQTTRIIDQFGNDAVYLNYGSGNSGLLNGVRTARRFLSLLGGHLDHYLNYSNGQALVGLPHTAGTFSCGHSREDIFNTSLLIMWGWNPAETIFGSGTLDCLKEAKRQGVRMIVIDPRMTPSAAVFADRYIPIKPGSDSALIDAMAYVIFTEDRQDRDFLERCCLGYDENSMPEGIPAGQSYLSWIMGEADNVPRSPGWAEKITGIPSEDIVTLAREYAAQKPASIIAGYGPQRHYNGEHFARGVFQLAALTGNVGIPGGGATIGGGYGRLPAMPGLPSTNTKRGRIAIPAFLWPQALAKADALTVNDGLIGTEKLSSGIKMIYNIQSNTLLNQHSDLNRIKSLLENDSLCEYIVSIDLFLTPSALYADLILPASSGFEKNEILTPWSWGDYLIFNNQVVEPLYESRSDFEWFRLLARELNLEEEYSGGMDELQWLEYLYAQFCKEHESLPPFEDFRRCSMIRLNYPDNHVPFREEVLDPRLKPFKTPSGKIEFFSRSLFAKEKPNEIPAVGRYFSYPEGPDDPKRTFFPLQMLSCHPGRRANSTFCNIQALDKTEPQAMEISSHDAMHRGISNGDSVRVFNLRGEVRVIARVSGAIMPGVVNLPQGFWQQSDIGAVAQIGLGNPNMLTMIDPSPLAKNNPQHTCLVEVEKI